MRRETEGHFLVATVILGFLSIFKKIQAWSPFKSLNSAHLSRCQRHVRSPVQMRRRTRAFSNVSTGDSNIALSGELKDEPPFKPLQGNLSFFRVRASQGRFHFRQKTQVPSHIHIAEGKLLLRCLRKVALPLQSKTVNQLSSRDDMGCMDLCLSCCTEIDVPLDLRRVSQGISGVS